MTAESHDWFAEACKGPLAFLGQRYGFEGPFPSRGGNEFTVHYRKKEKTVSISVEPFGRPIVELYYPSQDLKNRRIPLQTMLPPKKGLSDEEALARDLRHCATELEVSSRDFLSDEKPA